MTFGIAASLSDPRRGGAAWAGAALRAILIARQLRLLAQRLGLASLIMLAGCTTPKGIARWEMQPGDFERREVTAAVAPWEDGFRSPEAGGRYSQYEWWYFDGVLDDGSVVVVWFRYYWVPGHKEWRVNLEITPPKMSGRPAISETYVQREADAVSQARADVRIKTNLFTGDLNRYHVVVDPSLCKGSGVDLWLTRRVPSWRPGTGHFGNREDYFAWVVAVPEGKVEGSITERGVRRRISGTGYHDHNWGNVLPNEVLAGWWWGRAAIGEHTVVMADFEVSKPYGGGKEPLLLVTSPQGVSASLVGKEQVRVAYHAMGPSLDPRHAEPLRRGVTFSGRVRPVTVSAHYAGRLLGSYDLLEHVPWWAAAIGRSIGAEPWYTRLLANYSLNLDGTKTRSRGPLEYMDFRTAVPMLIE